MRLWSRICFLVLALPLVSRGQQNETPVPTSAAGHTDESHQDSQGNPATTGARTMTDDERVTTTATASPSENDTSPAQSLPGRNETTNGTTNVTEAGEATSPTNNTFQHATVGPAAATTAVSTVDSTTAAPLQAAGGAQNEPASNSWGYVVMAFIIVLMIILLIILYVLRRAARTYSFDLQRPPSANHFNEPSGTFEQVYVDDLERPVPMDTMDDPPTPPVANGTSLQPEEKTPVEESAAQEQPEANGVESSPPNASPSLDDKQADKTSDPSSSTDLFLDCIEEQQNENNNNPSVCSTDPFVEINLDEPEWCDQLIASTDAPSSTLPLSSFSFSSSSSS